MEANEPFAWDAVSAYFGRSELPAASRLQSEVGEILARPRRIEPGLSYIACGVHLNAHADSDDSMNGSEGVLGSVGQNLLEDFRACRR